MGVKQATFLADFRSAFTSHFGEHVDWSGGQRLGNTAALVSCVAGRRSVNSKPTERFELGDLTTSFRGWRIVVEFESGAIPLSNILKYWPYLRGELDSQPIEPVLLCHFSDWWSYATRRDLWEWTLGRMRADPGRLMDIVGHQFDHGGSDASKRAPSIAAALEWMSAALRGEEP